MSDRNICQVCGTEFEADSIKALCYECRKIDRHLFGIIRDFLYDNPGASVKEVVDYTGVTASIVLKYLREGRLETIGAIKLLNCESCGKPITYGNLCSECNEKLSRSFQSASNVKSKSTNKRMHTNLKKK